MTLGTSSVIEANSGSEPLNSGSEAPIVERVWFWEIVIIFALFSIFSAIMLLVIRLVFPAGITLQDLIQKNTSEIINELSTSNIIEYSESNITAYRPLKFSAELVWLSNDVRHRISGDIAWRKSRLGMMLGDNDALQTFDRSRAKLMFGENNYLEVDQNSLIIINSAWLYDKKRFPIREYQLAIEGAFEGKIKRSKDSEIQFKIMLDEEIVTIRPAKGETREILFKASKPERGVLNVAIYEGNAEIKMKNIVRLVEENQSLTITKDDIAITPEKLPPAPKLHTPIDKHTVYFREQFPKLNFSWLSNSVKSEYKFLLSNDINFENILINEKVIGDNFDFYNIKPGSYYWRVDSRVGSLPGLSGEVRKLEIIQDRLAPSLILDTLPSIVYDSEVIISGKVKNASSLSISNELIRIKKSGSFKHIKSLDPGVNIIVLEASDKVGNKHYEAKRIIRKF